MLKKLFYASASILMLAIAYHLGAPAVMAQSPSQMLYATGGDRFAAAVVGRTMHFGAFGGSTDFVPFQLLPGQPPALPGTADVIGLGYSKGSMAEGFTACLSNGDLYFWSVTGGYGTPWVLTGNIFSGGPTPAAQPTFGQLKAQYRK